MVDLCIVFLYVYQAKGTNWSEFRTHPQLGFDSSPEPYLLGCWSWHCQSAPGCRVGAESEERDQVVVHCWKIPNKNMVNPHCPPSKITIVAICCHSWWVNPIVNTQKMVNSHCWCKSSQAGRHGSTQPSPYPKRGLVPGSQCKTTIRWETERGTHQKWIFLGKSDEHV